MDFVIDHGEETVFKKPELSNWSCLLFGAEFGHGIVWTQRKGKEPNRFWRWMQYICFGNRWYKEKKEEKGGKMSSYIDKAVHPETGIEEDASYLDDYFGKHEYGVRFSDGKVFRIHEVIAARKKKGSG